MENPDELNGLIELNKKEAAAQEAEIFGENETTEQQDQANAADLFKDIEKEDPEDDEECQKLRTEIMLYLCSHRFRDFLRKAGCTRIEKKIETMKKKDLQHNLDMIKHLVENRNAGNIYEEMLKTGVSGIETVAAPRLDGLSKDINGDESLLDCLEEIRIKYPNLRISSPERRLAILIGMKVFNRYNKNRSSNVQIPQMVQNVIANPKPNAIVQAKPQQNKIDPVTFTQADMDLLTHKTSF